MNMQLAQHLITAIICLAYALGIYVLGTTIYDFLKYTLNLYTFQNHRKRKKRKSN